MKNDLTRKSCYSLFISILFSASLQAQIAYTDVNPDQTYNYPGTVYPLDVNNDGITDYTIKYVSSFPGACSDIAVINTYILITPENGNYVGNDELVPSRPLKLDFNALIYREITWKKDSVQVLFGITYTCQQDQWVGEQDGNWNNASDKYLPLKFWVGTNRYFGWLRMNVSYAYLSFGSFTIKDYACNTLTVQPLLAGESSCSPPAVTISASGPLSFCDGDSVTLSATSSAYKYQWKKDGIRIPDEVWPTYIAKTQGTYKVKVKNSCGSKSSAKKIITIPCRLPDREVADAGEHIAISPNPAGNILNVHLPGKESTINIFNLFGKKVFSENVSSREIPVDIKDFSAGMYMLRWSNNQYSEIKTFTVIR